MLYGGFKYQNLTNLGDEIQSIAAEKFLPKIDRRFNRDTLATIRSRNKYLLIMNGWFSHQPDQCFPPSGAICPVFWGVHITNWNSSWERFLSVDSISYLREHAPIGCRDMFTQKKLEQAGINSFYSKCLSLTFPKRKRSPKRGWTVIVDVPAPLPPFIEENAIRVTHSVSQNISDKTRRGRAKRLLDLYHHHANLVITTRLHCALPCISMGIPTIFFGDTSDYRTSIISDIGAKIYDIPKRLRTMEYGEELFEELQQLWKDVNWQPDAVDFETEKEQLITDFRTFLNNRISFFGKAV